MVLMSCAPVVGVLRFFFSPGVPTIFLREGFAGYFTPCRILVVLITSFLLSVRVMEFLLFDGGVGTLLLLQWGALGVCALWGVCLLASAE
jgi:hypothetical protein